MSKLFQIGSLLCLASFLMPSAGGSSISPNRLPSPNVCRVDSSFGWSSMDCPITALCAPARCGDSSSFRSNASSSSSSSSSTGGFCSCSFTEFMYTSTPEGRCAPTIGTYVYSIFWVVDGIVCLVIFAHMIQTFFVGHREHVFKIDTLYISAMSNTFSAFLQILHCALFARALVGNTYLKSSSQSMWSSVQVVVDGLYAASIVVTGMAFGIVAYTTVVQSNRLQKVDLAKLRRKVIKVSTFLGFSISIGGFALMSMQQYAASFAYFGVFAVIMWFLFSRILRQSFQTTSSTSFSGDNSNSNSNNRDSNNTNTTNNSKRRPNALISSQANTMICQNQKARILLLMLNNLSCPTMPQGATTTATELESQSPVPSPHEPRRNSASSMLLHEIQLLAARFAPSMLGYACFAAVYNVVWYVGRDQCNKTMLGPVDASLTALSFTMLTTAIGALALFMRGVVMIRVRQIRLPNAILT